MSPSDPEPNRGGGSNAGRFLLGAIVLLALVPRRNPASLCGVAA